MKVTKEVSKNAPQCCCGQFKKDMKHEVALLFFFFLFLFDGILSLVYRPLVLSMGWNITIGILSLILSAVIYVFKFYNRDSCLSYIITITILIFSIGCIIFAFTVFVLECFPWIMTMGSKMDKLGQVGKPDNQHGQQTGGEEFNQGFHTYSHNITLAVLSLFRGLIFAYFTYIWFTFSRYYSKFSTELETKESESESEAEEKDTDDNGKAIEIVSLSEKKAKPSIEKKEESKSTFGV